MTLSFTNKKYFVGILSTMLIMDSIDFKMYVAERRQREMTNERLIATMPKVDLRPAPAVASTRNIL